MSDDRADTAVPADAAAPPEVEDEADARTGDDAGEDADGQEVEDGVDDDWAGDGDPEEWTDEDGEVEGVDGEETEVFEYSEGTDEAEPEEDGDEYDAPPLPAAGVSVAVTGVLCGLATVGMVWLSGRGCDAASGAPNCGSLGLPLLIATVLIAIALGVVMLKRLMLPNAGLVSFLGVCFMLLIVVGFLSERLFTPWTLLVVPAISAVTFVAALRVTAWLQR